MRVAGKFSTAIFILASSVGMVAASEELIDLSLPVVASVGDIEFRECVIEAESRDRTVQCAWYEVPENYSEPEGKKIQIFIARLPARKPRKVLQPMLFLAGGPGQSASEGYLHIDQAFNALAKHRDFYLLDQRGTGHSNFLGCGDEINEEQLFLTQDAKVIKKLLRKCLKDLPGDSRFYTTSVAIQDFEKIREALNVTQWNLFGVSYGTRTGLHYMRKHPGSIRTVVLDSVVPPELALLVNVAPYSQKTLSLLYQRCMQDQECNKRFPDLAKEVKNLFSKLKASPVNIQVESFATGELEDVTFTRFHLMLLVRLYLYNTNSFALLPPMLHEASAKNNLAPLARAATYMIKSMENMMSLGMHNAVVCTEDFPFLQLNEKILQENAQTYMGAELLEGLQATCEIWPKGIMDSDFKERLSSEIPTLLVSGEYDPITPPEYAESILSGLVNAKHWLLKGQGHFSSIQGCAPRLITGFVNDASVEELDASCLDRLIAAPLFINFNGPSP